MPEVAGAGVRSGPLGARPGSGMKIERVEYVKSAGNLAECPLRPVPEIAVSGRSNVGKSSLLNTLLERRTLAKVSATPGKTQRLQFFLVNDAFHLVDLPGYGYARAPQSVRDAWSRMMQGYLRARRQLCGVVQLVDARHEPSREDREMVRWLRGEKLAFCLVPTKMDKLRQGERKPTLSRLVASLELPGDQAVVPYSSETGEGRQGLLDWIGQVVAADRGRPPGSARPMQAEAPEGDGG
jgi:GTP-binding protein